LMKQMGLRGHAFDPMAMSGRVQRKDTSEVQVVGN